MAQPFFICKATSKPIRMNLILLVTFQLIFGAPCLAFFHGGLSSGNLPSTRRHIHVYAEKVARDITGEELEVMLTEWDQPLVLDAYATWYVFSLCESECMLSYTLTFIIY